MPLEKQSETETEPGGRGRGRWGYRRCKATGSHGPCHLTSGHKTYCTWHEYIIRQRGARGISLEEFDAWRDIQIYNFGDRRWLFNTGQEWWEAVNGIAPLPTPTCDTCGTELTQGKTMSDLPDDRGKFCNTCWPGPLRPALKRLAENRQQRRAEHDKKHDHPRGPGGSGMARLGDIATQHTPHPAEEEEVPS